jgi:hypothetical protein
VHYLFSTEAAAALKQLIFVVTPQGQLHLSGVKAVRPAIALVSTDKLGKALNSRVKFSMMVIPPSLTRHFNYGLHVFFSLIA